MDVRADGGFIICPPSQRSDGRRYVVDNELPAASMPPWLLHLVVTDAGSRRTAAPASEWREMVRNGLPVGKRNAGLTRLSGYFLRHFIAIDLVAELVHQVNARSSEPLPASEVDTILESIAATELRRRKAVGR